MPNLSDYDPAVKYGANLDVNVDLADIRDANDNELLELDTVASAVNFISIANAATLSAPALTAAGDDTNVDLQLSPKGTAQVLIGDKQGGVVGATNRVTVNAQRGVITTPSLSLNAEGTSYTFGISNEKISGTTLLFCTLEAGTNTGGLPVIGPTNSEAGLGSVTIFNTGTATALNGTLKVNFIVL